MTPAEVIAMRDKLADDIKRVMNLHGAATILLRKRQEA